MPRRRARTWLAKIVMWCVRIFFAVILGFPFYWMLITTFKRNTDLNNLQNNPFIYNERPTLDHLKLLFHETMFPRWVLNTAFAGLVVVIITLLLAVPAAYAPVHPPVKGRRPPRPAGLPLVDHHRLPKLHDPVLDMAAHGLLQVHPEGPRRRRHGRRPDQMGRLREADDPDVDLRHPHRGDLRLHARNAGVRLRPDVHLLLRPPDRRRRRPHVPAPWRRLLLGLADGRLPDHEPADRDSVQPVPRPLHLGVYGGGGEVRASKAEPAGAWPYAMVSTAGREHHSLVRMTESQKRPSRGWGLFRNCHSLEARMECPVTPGRQQGWVCAYVIWRCRSRW